MEEKILFMEDILSMMKEILNERHFVKTSPTGLKNVELIFTDQNEVVVHVNGRYFSTYDLNLK